MTDYVAGIIALWILSVLQLNPWISRWIFGNKGRFLTVIGQKWSWCHFIKGCLVLSHLISTCHFSFIQQGKVEIISYPLVCHSPSFHRVHSTVAGIVVTVSVRTSSMGELFEQAGFVWSKPTPTSDKTRKSPIFCHAQEMVFDMNIANYESMWV